MQKAKIQFKNQKWITALRCNDNPQINWGKTTPPTGGGLNIICDWVSCSPGAFSTDVFQCIFCDNYIFSNLKIKHPDTDKVGAVFKGVLEAVPGVDDARGQNLIGNPGLLDLAHKFDSSLWSRRVVVGGIQGFEIKVRFNSLFFARYRYIYRMTADAGD